MTYPLVIIGTGLAGYHVAKAFRQYDTSTPITMITKDDGTYYSKPMLSSAFTTGKTPDMLSLGDANTMAEQLHATILTHQCVKQLNANEKAIILNDQTIKYSQCVIACGAHVIPAPLTGSGATDVFHVNNLTDYRIFRQAIEHKKTIALLGAGLIGCEFANDLMNVSKTVHCIALSKTPLDLLLPVEAGLVLKNAFAKHGVHWHLEQSIKNVEKTDLGLTLDLSEDKIHVDCLLSAIGIRPNIAFAKASNIHVNKGIVVNQYLETNLPDVYALGDCAEVEGWVLQYVAPLLACSRALGKTLSGEKTAVSYPAMPIVVKTPAYPVVVCHPPSHIQGKWTFTSNQDGFAGEFHDQTGALQGYLLTDKTVQRRAVLQKQLGAWLSSSK